MSETSIHRETARCGLWDDVILQGRTSRRDTLISQAAERAFRELATTSRLDLEMLPSHCRPSNQLPTLLSRPRPDSCRHDPDGIAHQRLLAASAMARSDRSAGGLSAHCSGALAATRAHTHGISCPLGDVGSNGCLAARELALMASIPVDYLARHVGSGRSRRVAMDPLSGYRSKSGSSSTDHCHYARSASTA